MSEYFNQLSDKIEDALVKGIDRNRSVLESSIHYSLSIKGKRLRPLIFLTLLEAFGEVPEKYLDIAAAIEYIHTYSLIHDDLPAMDNDDLRRGMPTVHKKYNEAIALLAGDTLLTMAVEKISDSDINAEERIGVLQILTKSIGIEGMAGGQSLDLLFEGDQEIIYEIHRKKTAELIKGTMLSAAEIAGIEMERKKILKDIGIKIGIAFQMADDLLDIIGNEKEVGKKLHKDSNNDSPNSVLYFGPEIIKEKIEKEYREVIDLIKKLEIDFPPFLDLIYRMVHRSK
ncbi:MAG: polyprenyl synthetase family protein [Acidobacteriota bacterium]